MGLFDALKKTAAEAVVSAVKDVVSTGVANSSTPKFNKKTESFSFEKIPENLEELKSLPQAALTSPFMTAALTVCALCIYGENREEGVKILNFLKGPKPLTPFEIQFLNDRFMDGKKYVPYSFFEGAEPSNDYIPIKPYRISIFDNPYSYQEESYAVMYIKSGGADSERQVKLRKKGDQWFLWEQFLLSDIKTPKSNDPWA